MTGHLAHVAILVQDYDPAIEWFQRCLGFHLLQDEDQGNKRWVVMAPSPEAETGFLLARAVGDQVKQIGHAAAGRVAFFLRVEDFDSAYSRMMREGVSFEELPRTEPYGRVAVFRDLYGNRWDLLGA